MNSGFHDVKQNLSFCMRQPDCTRLELGSVWCVQRAGSDLRKGVETVWLDPGNSLLCRALQSGVRESAGHPLEAAWTWRSRTTERDRPSRPSTSARSGAKLLPAFR